MKKKLLIVSLLTASTMLVAGNYSRANNIVTDHDTGLQWQDTPYTAAEKAVYDSRTQENGRVVKWVNAAAVCTKAGGGWRLATIKELGTLVDKNYVNPAMDPIFVSGIGLGFWSSTPSTKVNGAAQGIGFYGGNVHNCGMTGPAKFVRCVRTGGSTTPPPPPPEPAPGDNNPPVADAGPDVTVQVNTPATIIGKGTDSDGAIVKYQWTRKSDGSVWSNDEVLVFTPSGTRAKTFVLTVTDDEGAKDTDEMILNVTNDATPPPPPEPAPGNNNPPVADAGPDVTVQVNTPATIIGKGTDSDGAVVKYQWTRKSDGSVWSNDEVLVFTPSGTRTKTFVLTVTDDEGAKDSDEMVLNVSKDPVDVTPPPPSGNVPPTADAGPDMTVQVNTPVTIVGKASDSDGSIVAYEWKKQSNGQILSRSATLNFTPTGTRNKTLVFTVTDNEGATASDMMVLTVTK